ncbi:beta-aspartyl peptidase [Capsaspora owczarzaki ATCC 30864]|uniref:dihydropyrimidinase n=1 Tax=Capsaspora owczarzaki (strain ATCC 30864) TaxID=595528 RepID=A0A0D2WRW2_CAPO3|nr:beta-aspartyl peptidase [Capsaspora owczarzaki ATCC 30864]KJE94780.1 beta-aspartyl peptidase [Capsaspora owczarzaki ATCC 30864]|eukprot:XP_004347047.1 beta-aspartyl peptidase [Capsaspora owczarzaki ATCC 30864]
MAQADQRPAQSPLTLYVGAEAVYAPEPLGAVDVLVAGDRIAAILERGSQATATATALVQQLGSSGSLVDISGGILVPGLVDVHVHIAGGGGEMGPESRTPEAALSEIVCNGVTTLVGLTGTDSVTRSLENLLAKGRALQRGGLNVALFTGAYRTPPPTLTSSIMQDIITIEQIIGVGEIAISDHRSSVPSFDELTSIVSDARVAGMLAGKTGLSHFHVGQGAEMLEPLWKIVRSTAIPIQNIYPTHVSSRGPGLLADAKKWVEAGGHVDMTADAASATATPTLDALCEFKESGCTMSRITVSSDGYGSFPMFDAKGSLVKYGVGKQDALLATVRRLVKERGWSLEAALPLITSHPGDYVFAGARGRLCKSGAADFIVLNPELSEVRYVVARGVLLKTPTWVSKGMFES